jgi:hypothetical protein
MTEERKSVLLKYPFGLDCEAERYFGPALEHCCGGLPHAIVRAPGAAASLARIRELNEASREIEKLAAVASEFEEADSLEKVEAILSELDPEHSEVIRSHWPLEAGADPVAWYSKIQKDLARWTIERHEGADEFVKIFDLDTFDDDLARIERLDAMIDRTIKRLMQVKTMKQMHARLEPKLIDLSATKNPPAQDGTENRFN